MINNRIKKIFFIGLLLCLLLAITCESSLAADSDIIAKIVKAFADKAQKWIDIAKKYALSLFYLCAVLEVAFIGVKASLGGSDIREIFKNFCITLLACGFFLAVINNYYEWSHKVINGLLSISSEMGNMHNSSDNAFKAGLELCTQLWEVIRGISLFDEGPLLLGLLAALFIVVICFCQITAQVIFIKCEAYVAMLAACILVGFGASSFMRDYAVNVLKYILAVAFKLFVMQLVIGIGYTFMKEAITPKADFYMVCITIGVAVVLLALVKQLPDTVAGIIQGSHIGSGSGLAATASAVGAGLVGAGMMAAAGPANVGRAAMAARAQGATGVGGMVAGTARNLVGAVRQSMYGRADRNNTVASSLRARIEQARVEAAKAKKGQQGGQ